jgi:hypothetical protein
MPSARLMMAKGDLLETTPPIPVPYASVSTANGLEDWAVPTQEQMQGQTSRC